MDDAELKALFRQAPGEPPEASFNADDVAAASQRATARRRMQIASSSALAAVVLAGGGVFATVQLSSGPDSAGSAFSASEDQNRKREQPRPEDTRQESGTGPGDASMQGDAESERTRTDTVKCPQVDREIARALVGELPVTASPTTSADCLPTGRQAAFRVKDGADRGVISATLVPSATTLEKSDDSALTRTQTGDRILVRSHADSGSAPPLKDKLPAIARALAAKF